MAILDSVGVDAAEYSTSSVGESDEADEVPLLVVVGFAFVGLVLPLEAELQLDNASEAVNRISSNLVFKCSPGMSEKSCSNL